MKISITSDKSPLKTDPVNSNAVQSKIFESTPDSRVYLNLNDQIQDIPRRHPGELVMRNGWVHLDYDQEGFLVGLEFVEGDPFTGVTQAIDYLQPINPLVN